MTPNPPDNSSSPNSRPPKTGEPWPKRFSFTPDGSMSFVKKDVDIRRGAGPRRFDGPRKFDGPRHNDGPRRFDGPRQNEGPRSPGGPQRPDGPRRFDGPPRGEGSRSGSGAGRPYPERRQGPPFRETDAPRPWGTPRPGSPRFSGPASYGRPYNSQGTRPTGGSRPGSWQAPGSPPRPGARPFSPESGGGRPQRDWKSGPSDRGFRGPERPAFQTGYRKPGPSSGSYRDDRQPQGGGFADRAGGPRPWQPRDDRGADRPRPNRRPLVEDRTSARPWSGGPDQERPQRRLPRPQSGLDAPPRESRGAEDEAPTSREQLAVRIISRATSNIPADLLLRQTLSRRKQLSRGDGAWISRAVFSSFRWQGWLDGGAKPEDRMNQALALADDFAINPAAIPDAELLSKAVPAWIHAALTVTPEWVRSLQAEPQLWLRTRRGMAADVASKLEHSQAPAWAAFSDTLRYDGLEDLYRHELFQAGAFEIQDIASQAVGILCEPHPGETWWDACAGEGGKTLHLSSLMEGKGLVWASDRAEWRLTRLKQRAGRAGCFNYRSVPWNGGVKPPTKTQFDGVLLDAPCSGVGTWGRNPHARWTTQPQDVEELSVVQRDLLRHTARSVKPGGKLVYAVCTLTRAETVDVVEAFSAAHPEFEPVPLVNPFQPDAAAVHPLFRWPQDTGGNGMFVARWQRRPEPNATVEEESGKDTVTTPETITEPAPDDA